MGNRTQEQVKDGLGVVNQQRSRTFDTLSRLATELNGANALIASYSYDNNGNLKTATKKVDGSVANDELTAANENPSALGTFNFNLRFPGQYYDKETATHYNYFRDHCNPKIGRYMQSDLIGLVGGVNTYNYVAGDPISLIDPYGLFDMPSLPQPVVDIAAGLGDGASFGLTSAIRDLAGIDGGVDENSGLYTAASVAGDMGIGTAGAARGAAALGGTKLGHILNHN
ncbi:MAG: RHS repeat-associated core domain-containing protein [Burkholderiales bacterium]